MSGKIRTRSSITFGQGDAAAGLGDEDDAFQHGLVVEVEAVVAVVEAGGGDPALPFVDVVFVADDCDFAGAPYFFAQQRVAGDHGQDDDDGGHALAAAVHGADAGCGAEQQELAVGPWAGRDFADLGDRRPDKLRVAGRRLIRVRRCEFFRLACEPLQILNRAAGVQPV